MNIFYLENLIF